MRSTRAGRQGLLIGLLTLMLGAPVAWAANSQRDLVVMPKVAPGTVAIGGEYRALIIGIDKYRHVPPLGTAVRDALALRDMLRERYGFKPDHITLVVNDQATQRGIVDALYRLRKQAGKEDSVLIYYAGHGQIDADDGMGYWVPVEGEAHSPGTFLSNAVIRDEIANMKAKHVYVVADSCFAGTLFAKSRTLPPLNDRFFARLYATKSRWGLTSGQNEPVTDRGKDGHSIFAYFLLKLLGENEDPYLVPSHIYNEIAPLIGRNTEQQPRSEPLQNAGDEGGQFVFRLAAVGPASSGPASSAEGFLEAERKRLEEARRKLEAEKAAMAADQQMLKERARLEMERKQVEAERKKIEEARARPYEAPQQTAKEITGKDGAPMLLVPEGEFLYGDDNQRLSLSAFYMDKYEVPTRLYAKFIQDTSRAQPSDWSQQVALVGSGDRPVVNVSWHDAEVYCRQYGKRLPTEQEWEKAARGTDGRKYPWGNEEPTSRHALFNTPWNGYGTLAVVGSHEAGASPYGIQDLAGNVLEWTSSDYTASGKHKVQRGGSWNQKPQYLLRSAPRYAGSPANQDTYIGFRCAKTP